MPHQAAFGVVRICPWTQSLNPPPRTFYFIPSTWIHFVTADWSGGFHGWNALCHKKSMLALWLFWLHHCYCVSLTTCRDIVAKTVVSVSLVPPVPEQKTHKNWHVRPIDTLTHRSDAHIAAGQSEPLCCWTQTFCDVVIRVWSSSWSSRCRNKMDEWPVLFLLFRPQHTCQRLNNIAMLDLPPSQFATRSTVSCSQIWRASVFLSCGWIFDAVATPQPQTFARAWHVARQPVWTMRFQLFHDAKWECTQLICFQATATKPVAFLWSKLNAFIFLLRQKFSRKLEALPGVARCKECSHFYTKVCVLFKPVFFRLFHIRAEEGVLTVRTFQNFLPEGWFGDRQVLPKLTVMLHSLNSWGRYPFGDLPHLKSRQHILKTPAVVSWSLRTYTEHTPVFLCLWAMA